ncbi:hypothetical protein RKE29_10190 [Streptomyces sp. B1866]|uniref:hypothetical protein n=1 Tax=Streptomyces sp. B1866 TaxID=3075431 RepID=UPI00288D66A8|nr:hypothetical protein [Streptomyces sp. B1866]MDT3397010.1 hypothetical protein [Streptomyces sp. B1866]
MGKRAGSAAPRGPLLSGKRVGTALVVAGAVALAIVGSTAAAKGGDDGSDGNEDVGVIVQQDNGLSPEQARQHWTPERIKEAVNNGRMGEVKAR